MVSGSTTMPIFERTGRARSDLGRRSLLASCPAWMYVEEGTGGAKRGRNKKKPQRLSEAFTAKVAQWAARKQPKQGQWVSTNLRGPLGDAP